MTLPHRNARGMSSPGMVLTVLCTCGISVALMQTLVIPLVPILPRILHSSASDASWALTATLLAGAVVTPIAGRLGDMFGKRLLMLVSLVAMLAGSLLCALTDSLVPVVAGRALQGLASGAIALGISILRDEVPAERVGSSVAVMSATLGVGGAIGMPVAAVIAEKANWHALFWVSAALALICLVAVLAFIRESPVRTPGRFDFAGAAGLAVVLVCLLLAVTKAGDWGWTSGKVLGLLAAAVVLGIGWGAMELRIAQPLVDLRVSAHAQVLFTNLASVAAGFAMYGMSLIPSQLLMDPAATGYGMGLSMIDAGLLIMPSGLLMFAFSPIGAKISARWGPRVSLTTGITVIGLGYVLMVALRDNRWEIMATTGVIGAGVGIAYAAMPALIMGGVPITETAAANGLNSLMRALGTALSSAAIGMVLAHWTMRLGPATLPSAHGFTIALWISAAAAVLGVLLTLCIPRAKAAVPEPEPVEAAAG